MVTSYVPEPSEVAHLVRCACADIAFQITWNALQTNAWTEAQLAQLQERWQSVDFLKELPETAAYARANGAAGFKLERESSSGFGSDFKALLRSPKQAWPALKYYAERLHYRKQGIFEDERLFLLYEQKREQQLRQAVAAPSWSEMRGLPGVTNEVPFVTTNRSHTLSILNLRQVGLGTQRQGLGLLARAAETQARKTLIIAAIALQRYHAKNYSYPSRLEELSPQFLPVPPVDFMDGAAMRYRKPADGNFVLYSVGLDCNDDGGRMKLNRPDSSPYNRDLARGTTDLVWPRPASESEMRDVQEKERQREAEDLAKQENFETSAQWERTTRHQAKAETILKAPRPSGPIDVVYRGRSLSQTLANLPTTTNPSLLDLLSLEQIITGGEPEIGTFELPIRYDVLTKIGRLGLLVDPVREDELYEGSESCHYECTRATNGNCRLVWSTIYECPGQHALAAVLELSEPSKDATGITGPFTAFLVTNLCQFSLSSAHFDRRRGADIRIRIPEANGDYALTLKSVEGKNLRTISGSTTNHLIQVHWDLTDELGTICTNDSFDSIIQINLPASGRNQRMKGP